MIVVERILGHADDPAFAGRAAERLLLDSTEASRGSLVRTTDAGTEVALRLGRGAFVPDGAVLADADGRLIVAERAPEDALVVRPPADSAFALGYLLGNQHWPAEVEDGEVRVPVTTSRSAIESVLRGHGLGGLEYEFRPVKLACRRPLSRGHAH